MSAVPQKQTALRFRAARRGDGAALWQLVKSAGTLELNSAYFYLLFAEHFGATCLIAEQDETVVGGVIAYRPPAEPDAVFVWQIGVAPAARGQGLGKQLLHELLQLPGCAGVRWLTATVAEDNLVSARLFRGFARERNVTCKTQDFFSSALFPEPHSAEPLFRIGPF